MPTEPVLLEVVGLPAPQGSKVRMPNGVMLDGTSTVGRANLKAWRESVKAAAQAWLALHPQPPLDEPLSVALHFRFPLPSSDPHRLWHAGAPDVDKVVRSVFDSLTQSGLIKDDARICAVHATKTYAGPGEPIGCSIRVVSLAGEEAEHREASKAAARAARKSAKAADSAPLTLLR